MGLEQLSEGVLPFPRPLLDPGLQLLVQLLQGGAGGLEGRRAVGHPLLQLSIEGFQRPGLAMQFGENPHLGPQQIRHHRNGNIVDRAGLVALDPIEIGHMDRRYEDERGLLKAGVLADHGGKLKAVQFGHLDVDQHHRHVMPEKLGQRLARRRRLDQGFAELGEDDLIAQQLGRLVIDHQDGHGG